MSDLSQGGALPADVSTTNITVEPPRDPSHGDMATNAAMVLAKPAKMKPRDLAELLKSKLEALPDICAVEIAGPGFINVRFEDAFWHRVVTHILEAGTAYGDSALGRG